MFIVTIHLLFSFFTPELMICSSDNLGSLGKISFSYNVVFMTIWRRKAMIQKNIITWQLEAVVHLLQWN